MFSFIFLLLIVANGEQGGEDPNLGEYTKILDLDDQIDQIISILVPSQPYPVNLNNFRVLAQLKNSTYAIYGIQITNILENNLFRPHFEIQYLKYYTPSSNEKCLTVLEEHKERNTISIYCFNGKQLIIHKNIGNLISNRILNLDYTDPIHSIEIQVDVNYLIVTLNIHQKNWQIYVFLEYLSYFEEEVITTIYNSESFMQDVQLLIKKVYYQQQSLFILSIDNIIYELYLELPSIIYAIYYYQDQQVLDFVNFKTGKFILIKEQDICQILSSKNIITLISEFDCLSHDLELIVLDDQNIYIRDNNINIISLMKNLTFPMSLKYYKVINQLNLILNYGNSSQIFFTLLGNNTMDPHVIEIIPVKNDFEIDNQFLKQKHKIYFRNQESQIFQFTPFLRGPPFLAILLEDKFQLINRIDQPYMYNSCFNVKSKFRDDISPYEMFKMISETQFIYQQLLKVYYLQCNQDKVEQLTLLRTNLRTIKFISSQILQGNKLFIYFDDMDGFELFCYQITNINQNQIPQNFSEQKFQSPITFLKQYHSSITLQHLDKSRTLVFLNDSLQLQYEFITTMGDCDYVVNLQFQVLCIQNTLSDTVLVIQLSVNSWFYSINRYIIKNNLILDLIVTDRDQIILMLKDTINEEIKLQQYEINNNKIIYLSQIPSYNLKPQVFLKIFLLKFSVLALDQEGEEFLMVYDLIKRTSESLIRVIPYKSEIYCLSELDIIFLKLEQNENELAKFYIEKLGFSQVNLGYQQLQKQFKQYYTIKLQINNFIIKKDIDLNFTGLDFTGQLIQIKKDVPIFLNKTYQKINLKEYIYGPIHQIICLKNCSLQPLIIERKIHPSNYIFLIRAALVVENYIVIQLNRKYQMLNLQNIEQVDFKELNLANFNQNFIQNGLFKLIDSNLKELLVILLFGGQFNCKLIIILYSLEEQQQLSQFEISDLSPRYCTRTDKLKMRSNIILLLDQNQFIVYQYNFISKQFDIIIIQYERAITFLQNDYYYSNNLLYFLGAKHQDSVLLIIDLSTKSIICQYKYKSSKVITSVKIIDVSEQTVIVLYIRQSYPIIQHIYIKENKIDFVDKNHIQELVVDQVYAYHELLYYDQTKILFNVQYQVSNQYFSCSLLYLINAKEHYTFPSQNYSSMKFLLSQGNNQYIFINQSAIGEISIYNQYEIQATGQTLEIQVSNEKIVSIMKMVVSKDSNDLIIHKVGVLLISIGILIAFLWSKVNKRFVKIDI